MSFTILLGMFELFDIKTGFILAGILVVIALFRFFFKKKSQDEVDLEKEYNDVLNLDKYKVKGQW